MGKTTQTTRDSSQAKEKTDAGTSKLSSTNSSVQRKQKTRSDSVRRALVTTNPPAVITDQASVNPDQNRSTDVSDTEEKQTGPSQGPSRRTSAVHKFARKINRHDFQCLECVKVIRCTSDSTANIRRHLVMVHKKNELAYTSHASLRSSIQPEKKRILDEAAIRCIIVDGRPWGDFRREGMSKFLSIAIPGYYGPCGRTVQRNLSKLYHEKKEELKKEISQLSYCSITTDLWKSKRNRHYLCVTLHAVDEQFASKSQVLSFRKFHGRSFAKNIRSHLQYVIEEFGLSRKIISTTTDNGSNIKLATSKRKLFGIRVYCAAHALNLTVHNGLGLWPKKKTKTDEDEEIEEDDDNDCDDVVVETGDMNSSDEQSDDIMMDMTDENTTCGENSDDDLECLEENDNSSLSSSDESEAPDELNPMLYDITGLMVRCRSIVSTIRKSSILNDTMLSLARGSSVKVGLVLDMKIRWNSTFKMIHRLLLYRSTLEKFYEQMKSVDGITEKQRERLLVAELSEENWDVMHVLQQILERFDTATKIMSGQKYPTLSLAYAVTFSLFHYLSNKSTNPIENIIKEMLLEPFRKYMVRDGKEAELTKVAAFLDPMTHNWVSANDKKSVEAFIIKETKERQQRTCPLVNSSCNENQSVACGNSSISSSYMSVDPVKHTSIIRNFLNQCGIAIDIANDNSKVLTIEQELAKLSSLPMGDKDFTSFWCAHQHSMPQLAALARKYLSISATSVPSESTFSVSNHVLRKNRLSLSSKNIRYTMFLKDKLN